MLIKIGDTFVDPAEIAALTYTDDLASYTDPILWIRLRGSAGSIRVHAAMDEAAAALIDAGVIEDVGDSSRLFMSEEELDELRRLYDNNFEWLARDADGKLYAYEKKPTKDGPYWNDAKDDAKPVRVAEGFDFIDSADEEPWCIPNLLTD